MRTFFPFAWLVLAAVALTPARGADKPNVVFIVSDDLCNALSTYGSPCKTPNLDKLAARGVRFDRAYCQFPLCNPSRASFMTGLRPNTTGVLNNNLRPRDAMPDVVTLSQMFRNNGYFAARTGKIYHLGIPGGVGTAGLDDPQSWDHAHNPPGAEMNPPGEKIEPTKGGGQGFAHVIGDGEGVEQADYQAATEAIRLLEQKRDVPLFLAVGFIRPHVPPHAPRKYFDLYPLESIGLPKVAPDDRDDVPPAAFSKIEPDWDMSPEQQKQSLRAYYASTSFMDAQAGRVIDAVERLGQMDKTIFVFFGDHGYALGEHQSWQKMMLFEPVARVPLIIAAPGAKARGAGSDALVELIDVYPTLADLCGLTPPKNLEGASLRPVLDDPTKSVKPAAFTQVRGGRGRGPGGDGRSIRTDRWRYTEWTTAEQLEPARELYDHQSDPNEWTNLANDPKHAETMKALSAQLRATVLIPPPPPATAPTTTTRRARPAVR